MRSWVPKFALLGVVGLLSLAVCEVAVRLVLPQDLGLWVHGRNGLIALRADNSLYLRRWDHRVETNSLGLRGDEPGPKKAGTQRILVLGDSFIEALQLRWPDAFSPLLEDLLVQRGAAVDVVSAGVSGWGTDDEVTYLNSQGLGFAPDVVLVAVTLYNDVLDNLEYEFHRFEGEGAGKLVAHSDATASPLEYFRLRLTAFAVGHSQLYQLMRSALGRRSTGDSFQQLQHHWVDLLKKPAPDYIDEGWRLTLALLDETQRSVAAAGAKLVVVLIPMEHQLGDALVSDFLVRHGVSREAVDVDAPQRRVLSWGADRGIEVIDLSGAFRADLAGGGPRRYLPDDGHWNADGHALAARVSVEALLARGIVETKSGATSALRHPRVDAGN